MSKKPRHNKAKARSARASARTRAVASRADRQMNSTSGSLRDVVSGVPAAFARGSARAASAGTVPTPGKPGPRSAISGPPAQPVSAATGVRVATGGCSAVLDEADPQGLAATYWFDAPTSGDPAPLRIRFTGVRMGVEGTPGAGDRFERVEPVDSLPAGCGRVAVTTRIRGINTGTWQVTATAERAGTGKATDRVVQTIRTRLAPSVWGPGVRVLAWPALVGLGAVMAVVFQAVLLGRTDVNVTATVGVSLVACVVGLAGAKVWYLVLHRRDRPAVLAAGACIQGFLLASFATVAVAGALLHLPVGVLLDASAPGLFFAMAVGRPGCWLTGCCSGRPTNSRWGLWSSDRRLAVRRFPVQLLEAALALAIGVGALAVVLTTAPPVPGVIFAGALAAYTFGRQPLFALRGQPHTPAGRALTMGACGLVLLSVLAGCVYA